MDRWVAGYRWKLVLMTAAVVACGPQVDPPERTSANNDMEEQSCLPADFDECEADNGSMEYFGEQTCWYYVDEDEDCFEECEAAGGGITVADPSDTRTCKVVYGEISGPCYGNACD